MTTRGQWAAEFLRAMGNQSPDVQTIRLVASWTKAENTKAKYNPLATTWDTGTGTDFNSAGVQSYPDRATGIQASIKTLTVGNHAGYKDIYDGLRTNNTQLALSGMLNPLNQWGTNFGTVSTYFHSQDVTGETLLSESPETLSKVDDTPVARGTKTDAPAVSITAGAVTADSVASIVKIGAGIVVGIIGGFLIIKIAAGTDAAKTAINVAKIAAIA